MEHERNSSPAYSAKLTTSPDMTVSPSDQPNDFAQLQLHIYRTFTILHYLSLGTALCVVPFLGLRIEKIINAEQGWTEVLNVFMP